MNNLVQGEDQKIGTRSQTSKSQLYVNIKISNIPKQLALISSKLLGHLIGKDKSNINIKFIVVLLILCLASFLIL